ncbi:unnamed protein product [Adineta steineri]|uniref:Uncharacterized protein n=1 Tax=Adineta steineri TaxID=433720 RepID=A0A818S668_9BILA|nr:unnamed protein product [Adineta steineri]CAF3664179.1 unnamed protein product [Adineta steineri]
MDIDKDTSTSGSTTEFVPYVDSNHNRRKTSPSLSPTRLYSSPLMGTSARAAKRRLDGDMGPVRIDGTDTYNQQLQHHYQNVRQVLDDQESSPTNINHKNESRQSFNAKRNFFEERFKPPPPPTYDSPPREHQSPQQIVTTITTTTSTSPKLLNRKSLQLNDSSLSVDHILEQANELQKLSNDNSTKDASQQSLVIERTQQYQVYLDRTSNPEVRHASSSSDLKKNQTTDLDQAQTEAQMNRSIDDHQAIQQLTRVLKEHSSTTNLYKRLSSQTSPVLINSTTTTTTTIPTDIKLADLTNKPIGSEFSVIDALLDNPIGTNNSKQNDTLHKRFNNIITSLQNSEYVNLLRQSITRSSKKRKSTDETQLTNSSDQTPLLSSKQKKKNKKKEKKSKKTEPKTYQVIDALVNSPIILRLPDSVLRKYNVRPPVSQLSPFSSIITKDNNILFHQPTDYRTKNETRNSLVNEPMIHHTAAANASIPRATKELQQPIKPNYFHDSAYQQHPISNSNQPEAPIKPRIIYRYLDEQGNVLKLSSTAPSQLRENTPEQSQQTSYQHVEPKYFYNRQIMTDDNRHAFIPERQERRTWHEQSNIPTKKNDKYNVHDIRDSRLSERSTPTTRTIPLTIEREHSRRTPTQQNPQHFANQQNLKLAWLPLSYQLDQPYIPSTPAGDDTDSTTSDHSVTYRTYDYLPINNTHSQSNNRPLFRHDYYQDPSPERKTYTSPPRVSSRNSRNISPAYSSKGFSRNYIEIFRDGETKPSEIYSLPINEPGNRHHSRYDQHEAEISGKSHDPLITRHEKNIPSSSPSNHDSYYSRTAHNSRNRDDNNFDSYLSQSKSFDYRPLRTKLQREYKITPSLLVDEWDHPQQSISNDSYKTTSVSSPDDVFINNHHHRINKA